MSCLFCCPLATSTVNLTAHRSITGQRMQLFGLWYWLLHLESWASKPICNCGILQPWLPYAAAWKRTHRKGFLQGLLGLLSAYWLYLPPVLWLTRESEWNNVRRLLQFCFSPSSAAHHSYHRSLPLCFQSLLSEVTSTPAVLLRLTVLNLN